MSEFNLKIFIGNVVDRITKDDRGKPMTDDTKVALKEFFGEERTWKVPPGASQLLPKHLVEADQDESLAIPIPTAFLRNVVTLFNEIRPMAEAAAARREVSNCFVFFFSIFFLLNSSLSILNSQNSYSIQ